MLLTIACGGDEPERDSDESRSYAQADGGAMAADAQRPADASADGRSAAPDATSPSPDAAELPARTWTLAEALREDGVAAETERANLVIEAACTKLASCGAIDSPPPTCIGDTLSDWSLGALFYEEACLDAQLDLFGCYARMECEQQTQCNSLRMMQQGLCKTQE